MSQLVRPFDISHNAAVRANRFILTSTIGIAVSGAACWTPWPILALPAGLLLAIGIPARSLARLLGGFHDLAARRGLSVAFAMVLLPVLLDGLWRLSNRPFHVLLTIVAFNVALLVLAARRNIADDPPTVMPPEWGRRWLMGILVWTAACVFASFYLPFAGNRPAVTGAHDYTKHHAVVFSLEHHPLPLHSVFFAAEEDGPYYYYDHYYLLPAALRALTGNRVSIALAFGLTSAILAAAFIATVYALAYDFLKSAPAALLSAACVSVVGGWDALAVAARWLAGGNLVVTLDSWSLSPWRIHNLATQLYWCPQHVCAVTALLVACVLLARAPRARWWLVLAPILGATVFGSSVYLAITVFIAAALYCIARWLGARAAEEQPGTLLGGIAIISVVGALLMLPQALGYGEMSSRFEGGLTMHWDRFPHALFGRLLPPGPLANFLDVPWMVLIDFGFTAVASLLIAGAVWRRVRAHEGMRLLLIAGIVGLLAMFTVRSDINPIDYGFRVAIMPTMVLAAIVAGAFLDPQNLRPWARRLQKPILVFGVGVGLTVGFYELPLAAGRSLLETKAYSAEQGAIRYLRDKTPPDAVVQGLPNQRQNLPQLSDRQMGVADAGDPHVRVFWPKQIETQREAMAQVETAFSTADSVAAHGIFRALGITHLLIGQLERERFGDMPQLNDPQWFTIEYADEHATVYRVRD